MSSVSLASLVYRRGGANLGFRCLSLIRPIDFHLSDSSPLLRHFSSQLVKTHVRKLEAQGLPTKQAEAIASTITETLNNSLGNMTYSFVSKSEMDKIEKIQDSNLSKFKSEMKSTQEHHFSLLQQETRKLQGDIEKVTAGHCLDLNLERGRIRDELTKQAAENTELTNKLDREIQSLRTHLETTKYDAIKYRIGTLVSLSSIGLIIVQIWLLNL
ncbi:protein FMP32, mitochondrial-like isoform X3 [Zingiber officinale]|uniref:protein FMP32, mitochondrial-like isoform X3 n=1 Tax=Zingiber officinale TaxID=94328 RepID=UPI001C4D044D|nr:protein FMP32, mitochondrial-like isoform X3 [Zingiber officinale]